MVVTTDGDYHALLALGRHVLPSVIRFRIQELDDAEAAKRIAAIVDFFARELLRGVAISAPRETTQLHRLPLVR